MTKNGHNHAEAFCHMRYASRDPRKQISVIIFNSRDGVTPFIFHSKEFDVELQHVNFASDQYDPGYKPKKGDLIWRDANDEDKQRWFESKKATIRYTATEDKSAPPEFKQMASQLLRQYEEHPESFFEDLNDGEPVFELVK